MSGHRDQDSYGELQAFELGQAAAFEWRPDDGSHGSAGTAGSGETVTTLISWWNHLLCDACGHTFRRGDRVVRDAMTRTVRHLEPTLGCSERAGQASASASDDGDVADPDDLRAFAEGLHKAWPPEIGVPVTHLSPDDWRVRRPPEPLERTRCLYCAHTFRPDEQVVICPCSPQSPVCGAAVHRDPIAGLVCWESWRPEGDVRSCPVTAQRRTSGRGA